MPHPCGMRLERGGFALGAALAVLLSTAAGADLEQGTATRQNRAFDAEEIQALWERRPVREAAHRRYIFIDEEDIVEGTELPEYRIEADRYGPMRQLQRMVHGDAALAARIADLAPDLAAETIYRSRHDAAFFTARPGVARDVPQTPDLVGPLVQSLRSRF